MNTPTHVLCFSEKRYPMNKEILFSVKLMIILFFTFTGVQMSKISIVTLSILGKNIFVFRLENFFNKGEHFVYNEIPPMLDLRGQTMPKSLLKYQI